MTPARTLNRARRHENKVRRSRTQRGSASLELVVVFPVVLLIIFSVIQGALYFHARNVALAAAQEGSRAASAEHGTATAGDDAAMEFLTRAGGAQVLTQLDVSSQRTATAVSVTVTGRSLSVLPGIPGFTVTQTADRPVERFISSAGGQP